MELSKTMIFKILNDRVLVPITKFSIEMTKQICSNDRAADFFIFIVNSSRVVG